MRQESKTLVRPGDMGPVRQLWDSMVPAEQEPARRTLRKQPSRGLVRQDTRKSGIYSEECSVHHDEELPAPVAVGHTGPVRQLWDSMMPDGQAEPGLPSRGLTRQGSRGGGLVKQDSRNGGLTRHGSRGGGLVKQESRNGGLGRQGSRGQVLARQDSCSVHQESRGTGRIAGREPYSDGGGWKDSLRGATPAKQSMERSRESVRRSQSFRRGSTTPAETQRRWYFDRNLELLVLQV